MFLLRRLCSSLIFPAIRARNTLQAVTNRYGDCLSGLAMGALDEWGRARLTERIYNAQPATRQRELFTWEEEWFSHDLPPAPARILLGGAGSGREVGALIDRGYRLAAFDPAAACVAAARRALSQSGCLGFFRCSYEELPNAHGRNPAPGQISSLAPFDAVICGWGSFTHIANQQARIKVLEALRRLCPRGPLLLSFWLRENEPEKRSRAWRAGYRLGRLCTGTGGAQSFPDDGDDFTLHAGFGHFFTPREIEALLFQGGYVVSRNPVVDYLRAFPHLTGIPAPPPVQKQQ